MKPSEKKGLRTATIILIASSRSLPTAFYTRSDDDGIEWMEVTIGGIRMHCTAVPEQVNSSACSVLFFSSLG